MRIKGRSSVLCFLACGAYLIGLGVYFAFFRPALLPEDPRFMGSSVAQIRTLLPGLEHWLGHVFNVMGGFMAGAGVLTVLVATALLPEGRKGIAPVLALAGLATVVTMSWTNFAIDSDFKWVLLARAALWVVGLGAYLVERRDPRPKGPELTRSPAMPASKETIARTKKADLAGSGGAGILGAGLGVLLMELARPAFAAALALALIVVGAVLHGWGMYERHRIEHGMEVPWWSRALYWLCWIALGILLAWISLAAFRN